MGMDQAGRGGRRRVARRQGYGRGWQRLQWCPAAWPDSFDRAAVLPPSLLAPAPACIARTVVKGRERTVIESTHSSFAFAHGSAAAACMRRATLPSRVTVQYVSGTVTFQPQQEQATTDRSITACAWRLGPGLLQLSLAGNHGNNFCPAGWLNGWFILLRPP